MVQQIVTWTFAAVVDVVMPLSFRQNLDGKWSLMEDRYNSLRMRRERTVTGKRSRRKPAVPERCKRGVRRTGHPVRAEAVPLGRHTCKKCRETFYQHQKSNLLS